jgi:hypothetical protein
LSRVINTWVVIGAIAVFAALLGIWAVVLWYFHPEDSGVLSADAVVTVIAGPTLTPIVTPSPTGAGADVGSGTSQNGIAVGMFVQISGTEDAGLRLRMAPGTASEVQFVALEGEVFEVTAGPDDQDGYTWWHLVSPYDGNRSGWAASSYMVVIAPAEQ